MALSPKKKSLVGFALLLAAIALSAAGSRVAEPWTGLAAGLPLLVVAVAFLFMGRINCPHCGARVKGPGGINPAPLLLLWAARESCAQCHQPLEW